LSTVNPHKISSLSHGNLSAAGMGTAGEYHFLLTRVFSYANEIFLSEKTAGGYRPESITLSRIPAGIHPANFSRSKRSGNQCETGSNLPLGAQGCLRGGPQKTSRTPSKGELSNLFDLLNLKNPDFGKPFQRASKVIRQGTFGYETFFMNNIGTAQNCDSLSQKSSGGIIF